MIGWHCWQPIFRRHSNMQYQYAILPHQYAYRVGYKCFGGYVAIVRVYLGELEPMSTIQVVLADDHTLVREGFRRILEQENDISVIGEVNNGKNLIEQIEGGIRPDVILMDVNMPEMTGIEATKRVGKLLPNTSIIGLSAEEEKTILEEMVSAGASDFVVKSSGSSELVDTIRKVHLGQSESEATVLKKVRQKARRRHKNQLKKSRAKHLSSCLTSRELDVMTFLTKGNTNREIADKLYISERTVQTHLSNIFHKFQVSSRTEAVLVAVRQGWLAES